MNRSSVGLAVALAVTLSARVGVAQTSGGVADSVHSPADCGACVTSLAVGLHSSAAGVRADTGRPRAIEYSDAYAVRLRIHQIGSYIELPLFAAEYVLGQKLLNDTTTFTTQRGGTRSSLRGWHNNVAAGLGALFTVNTVTGVWNLIESRHDPAGRTRRWLHSLAMLAADGGFALTANAGGAARRTITGADNHRNLAIGSMSLAAASTLMMWLWKN